MEENEYAGETHASATSGGHIGTLLQSARLEQNRELSDIAAQTRVPLRHLSAIEEGRHDDLPALPYTLGFVKNYARAIGMDPEAAAAQFRGETNLTVREPTITVMEPIDVRRSPPRSAIILGPLIVGLLAIVILAWGSGWFGGENDVAEVNDDPLADMDVADNVGTAAPEIVAALAPAPEPALPTGEVVITASADAWMRISNEDGRDKLFERVLAAGESYTVPAGTPDLYIKAGNAGALTLTIGGTEMPKLGGMGSVVGPVALTAEALNANADGDTPASDGG